MLLYLYATLVQYKMYVTEIRNCRMKGIVTIMKGNHERSFATDATTEARKT